MPYEIWQHWRVITMIPLPGLTSVCVRFGGVSLSLYPDCGQRRSYFIPSKNKTAHERSKKAQGTPVAQWNETNCSSFISGCVVLVQLTPIILILHLVLDLLRCIRCLLSLTLYFGQWLPFKLFSSIFLCFFWLFCLGILEASIVVISLVPLLPILISHSIPPDRASGV